METLHANSDIEFRSPDSPAANNDDAANGAASESRDL